MRLFDMSFFSLFLPALALMLSLVSMGVLYWVITRCKQNIFLATYYFLGLSSLGVIGISLSRISKVLFGQTFLGTALVQDLMVAYIALFIFGALWQSYETEICVPPKWMEKN